MALIIVFHNDGTGPDESANYNVTVYVNQHVIHTQRIEGHKRESGWRALVDKFCREQLV